MQEGEGKLAALVSAVIGSANMQESIQTRQQLKAIFSTVDTAETGKLNVYQLKELMDLLKIHGEEGKALGMDELNEIMEEMDAFHGTGEVSFDDFVTWALSSSTGAGASDILRMRVTHRKKEMHSIEQLFDKVDQDCDGKMDSADLKLLIKHIGEMKRQMLLIGRNSPMTLRVFSGSGLTLNTREFYSTWVSLDRDRGGDVVSDSDAFSICRTVRLANAKSITFAGLRRVLEVDQEGHDGPGGCCAAAFHQNDALADGGQERPSVRRGQGQP